MSQGTTRVPPPRMQAGRVFRAIHRRLAPNAERAAVRWLRRRSEDLFALLHSENHDMRTNGELELVRRLAPNLAVVVDVGANRGEWTTAVSQLTRARILCSEILPATRERLAARVGHLPSVEVLGFGLGDASAIVTVKHHLEDDRWSSLVDYPHPGRSADVEARIERGDDALAAAGVDHVDLLKVDAEGADLAVLRGFSGMLARRDIDVAQFEYGYACVLARAFLLDFYELLEGAGYVVGRLGPRGVEVAPYRFEAETFFGPNFVAVRADRPDLIALIT